jgi:hypothetical protein
VKHNEFVPPCRGPLDSDLMRQFWNGILERLAADYEARMRPDENSLEPAQSSEP